MTMIERVARAIYEVLASPSEPDWDNTGEETKGGAHQIARAAIEAMREPSPKMLEEGFGALISGDDDALDTAVSDAAKCWRAMIDAALKEG